jgi:hypothetical protein|tara:strand:+ start:401 stop:538 length:138 start_codon:yes stop_codon:yes gene_type:complete
LPGFAGPIPPPLWISKYLIRDYVTIMEDNLSNTFKNLNNEEEERI